MTHKDIYIKFMIEYDKANVTSSYPSLTEYEVATVLDKAYNALIAQKVTGNNVRRAPFEADLKSITDLSPLVTSFEQTGGMVYSEDSLDLTNYVRTYLPDDFLYFVGCEIKKEFVALEQKGGITPVYVGPVDQLSDAQPGIVYRRMPAKLVSHETAEGFKASSSNMPWIKTPVCCIESDVSGKPMLYIYFDPYDKPFTDFYALTYIKKPNRFVKNLEDSPEKYQSFFDCSNAEDKDIKKKYQFELNDTMAEELISLAISFALENIESPRLNTKLNMRGLES